MLPTFVSGSSPTSGAASTYSPWTTTSLQRAVDELHAMRCMYDGLHSEPNPCDVRIGGARYGEAALEMAQSALDNDGGCAAAVPELEVTVRLRGPRLRGDAVHCTFVMPPGYPETVRARPRVSVECAAAAVTWAELDALHAAAEEVMRVAGWGSEGGADDGGDDGGDNRGGRDGGDECAVMVVEAVRERAEELQSLAAATAEAQAADAAVSAAAAAAATAPVAPLAIARRGSDLPTDLNIRCRPSQCRVDTQLVTGLGTELCA